MLRPTAERVRESLFNILVHGKHGDAVSGARVLDAFAGTGALGLEALSRGASHVTFMEVDRKALAGIERTLANLDEEERGTAIRADATLPPRPTPGASAALVFLDPPYRSGLAEPATAALASAGWLAPNTLLVVELAAGEDIELGSNFSLDDTRRYGDTELKLFVYS